MYIFICHDGRVMCTCMLISCQAVITLREMDSSSELIIIDALVYLSNVLPHFSDTLITQALQQISTTPGNEIKELTMLSSQLCVSFTSSPVTRLVIKGTHFRSFQRTHCPDIRPLRYAVMRVVQLFALLSSSWYTIKFNLSQRTGWPDVCQQQPAINSEICSCASYVTLPLYSFAV